VSVDLIEMACVVVGVTFPPSSVDSVKRAYRKASLKAHPDMGGSNEEFAALSNAYRMLVAHLEDSASNSEAACLEPEPLNIGDLVPVIGIRSGEQVYTGKVRCTLTEVSRRTHDRFGSKVVTRLCLAVQFFEPVSLPSSIVELVLQPEDGAAPEVLVREIVDRSYVEDGRCMAIMTDALQREVISEVYDYAHAWWQP
jgi:hypothetical protein